MALPWDEGPDGSMLGSTAGRHCLPGTHRVPAACQHDETARKAKRLGATPPLCRMAGGTLPNRIKRVWMNLSAAYGHCSCPGNACSSLGRIFRSGEVGG